MIWVIVGLTVWMLLLLIIIFGVKGVSCPKKEQCEDRNCLNCKKDENGNST